VLVPDFRRRHRVRSRESNGKHSAIGFARVVGTDSTAVTRGSKEGTRPAPAACWCQTARPHQVADCSRDRPPAGPTRAAYNGGFQRPATGSWQRRRSHQIRPDKLQLLHEDPQPPYARRPHQGHGLPDDERIERELSWIDHLIRPAAVPWASLRAAIPAENNRRRRSVRGTPRARRQPACSAATNCFARRTAHPTCVTC